MENLIDYLIYALMGQDVHLASKGHGADGRRQWLLNFGYHKDVALVFDETDIEVIKYIAAIELWTMTTANGTKDYLTCANSMESFKKNVPGWKPSNRDYRLMFREVDGVWREISNNLPQYSGMILADYLALMGIDIPDGCQFCRIIRDNLHFEFREYGGTIRIDVDIKEGR